MRYVSNNVISFSIRLKDRKDSVRIDFSSTSDGGSSFSTEEPKVIEALEQNSMYGTHYRRAPECVNEDVKPARRSVRKGSSEPKKVEVKEVQGWQDAVEYLVNNHGSDASKLTSPSMIVAEAEKVGVTFPNL